MITSTKKERLHSTSIEKFRTIKAYRQPGLRKAEFQQEVEQFDVSWKDIFSYSFFLLFVVVAFVLFCAAAIMFGPMY